MVTKITAGKETDFLVRKKLLAIKTAEHHGSGRRGNIFAEALFPEWFPVCAYAEDLLRKQFLLPRNQNKNVPEVFQKHFVSVTNVACLRAQTGKHCCRNILRNVSATMFPC